MAVVNGADQTRTIPNYRQQVRKALPDYMFKPDYGNLWWFLVHFAIIGGCFYVLAAHFSFWVAPICSILIGHSMASMGFLAHDIAHGGTIRSIWLRDLLAGIGFSPLAISPYLWRRWHNSDHHNNTQVKGVDPDHLFTMEDYKHNAILRALYRLSPLARNLVIFSSFTYRMTQQQLRMVLAYVLDKKSTWGDRIVILGQLILAAAVWAGGTWMLGSQVFIWGYLVALLVANAVAICYIATNHFLNPLADERDVLATSLTVTLPRGLKWLDPCHQYFGAHVAHHLFPQASSRYARQIEAKIEEMFPDRYHTMPITTALVMLWRTPWIYEDETTFIDPERQERAKTLGHGLEEQLPPKR
jgi:fatty acid desaturase